MKEKGIQFFRKLKCFLWRERKVFPQPATNNRKPQTANHGHLLRRSPQHQGHLLPHHHRRGPQDTQAHQDKGQEELRFKLNVVEVCLNKGELFSH